MNNSSGVAQNGVGSKKVSKGKFVKGQQSGKTCSHYGKTGYTMETCFKKHDFPPFKKGQGYFVNNVSFEDCDEEDDSSHEESQPVSHGFSLMKEQYQGLLALLHQSQSATAHPPSNPS